MKTLLRADTHRDINAIIRSDSDTERASNAKCNYPQVKLYSYALSQTFLTLFLKRKDYLHGCRLYIYIYFLKARPTYDINVF